MDKHVLDDLNAEVMSEQHNSLLEHCKKLVAFSRRHMNQYYTTWDRNRALYENKRVSDLDDKKASERGEPEKMIVPITYSQVETFVSFLYTLYTQRDNLFELSGTPDTQKSVRIAEALLERDLSMSDFRGAVLEIFLRDIALSAVGVMKHTWVHETQVVESEVQLPPEQMIFATALGEPQTQLVKEIVTKFMGNRIVNVSPYRFFPDVRLPLSRFQEGEFCASEDEFSHVSLKGMEKDGLIAGLKYVKNIVEGIEEPRRRLFNDIANSQDAKLSGLKNSKNNILITECQINLIPNEYEFNGKKLGEEDYPVKYVIWIANDNRLVRCERMNYKHNNFTYHVGLFAPDVNSLMLGGLADSIDMIQDTISWFINSHITSVRKTISNYLIVDPTGIEMKDLHDRNPVLRLKPTAARSGVDRWVRQLNVQDVTQNHMQDAQALRSMAQDTTGINENLMGQFSPGRRSASEARAVNQSAAGRMKKVGSQIWHSCFKKMGEMLLSNHRDGLDIEQIVRIIGLKDAVNPLTGQLSPAVQQFIPVSKKDIVDNLDFVVFDGTLPSEKNYIAQSLQEVAMAIISNPQAAQLLGLDFKKLYMESMKLRGIKNLEDFSLPPDVQSAMAQQAYSALIPPPPQPPQPGMPPNGQPQQAPQ
jgi:hypothetical protein